MSPVLRRGTGRHRKTWWGRWKRRKKMPESFPIVIMMFCFLIGISAMGFILTPSEKGSDNDRVRPSIGSPSTSPDDSGLVGS